MTSFTDYLCGKNEQIFNFKTVSEANVSKIISEIKSKTVLATTKYLQKMLKLISNSLVKPLTLLINQCLYRNIPRQYETSQSYPNSQERRYIRHDQLPTDISSPIHIKNYRKSSL